jgi:hypothetical protein
MKSNEDFSKEQKDKESTLRDLVNRLHLTRDKQLARNIKNKEKKEENELKGFTGRPQINIRIRSQQLFDSLSKIEAWNSKMEKQKYKRIQEIVEENNKKERIATKACSISKGSLKYLESTGRLQRKERIELRLLKHAQQYIQPLLH